MKLSTIFALDQFEDWSGAMYRDRRYLHLGTYDLWEIWSAGYDRAILPVSRGSQMPRLSDVMSGADTTWGEQLDKGSLRGLPFWIHNARSNSYPNPDPKTVAIQPTIDIIVLDITLNGPSRRDPHAVITVGDTPERAPMLAYFNNPTSALEPLGPCHTFEVPLKGGRSFWRIEDWDEEILMIQGIYPDNVQFDANGQMVLPSGK